MRSFSLRIIPASAGNTAARKTPPLHPFARDLSGRCSRAFSFRIIPASAGNTAARKTPPLHPFARDLSGGCSRAFSFRIIPASAGNTAARKTPALRVERNEHHRSAQPTQTSTETATEMLHGSLTRLPRSSPHPFSGTMGSPPRPSERRRFVQRRGAATNRQTHAALWRTDFELAFGPSPARTQNRQWPARPPSTPRIDASGAIHPRLVSFPNRPAPRLSRRRPRGWPWARPASRTDLMSPRPRFAPPISRQDHRRHQQRGSRVRANIVSAGCAARFRLLCPAFCKRRHSTLCRGPQNCRLHYGEIFCIKRPEIRHTPPQFLPVDGGASDRRGDLEDHTFVVLPCCC